MRVRRISAAARAAVRLVGALLVLGVLALPGGCRNGEGGGTGGGSSAGPGGGGGGMPAPLSPPVTVRIAEDGAPSGAGFYLADARGYFRDLGLNVEWVKFANSQDMLPALATGKVDLAGGVTTASLFNAVGRGLDVRMIADKGTNIPGRAYFQLVLRKDLEGEIRDFSDLKGRRIGVTSPGSLDELTLDKALKAGGLTLGDVEEIFIGSFPDMLTALANRSIDAAMQIEPLITKGVEQGVVSRWRDAAEYARGAQIALVLASPQFTSEKKEAAKRFMVAYLKGLRDYNDAFLKDRDKDAVIEVMTRYTVLKDKALWQKVNPTGLNPDGYLNKDGVADDLKWYRDRGLVKGTVDLDRVVDHSLVDYALGVLGPYGK